MARLVLICSLAKNLSTPLDAVLEIKHHEPITTDALPPNRAGDPPAGVLLSRPGAANFKPEGTMDIDTLTIGDAKEAIERGKQIEAALGGKVATTGSDEGLNIVIFYQGFIYVGDVSIDGDWLLMTNAKNVRNWGTSEGLGELAAKGPLPETELDMGGTLKAPIRAVVGMLRCEVASWKK